MQGNSTGKSDEWYTPPEIIDAIGLEYDLDPCSPGRNGECYVPARYVFVKTDDGLSQDWKNHFVFMNPPFGGRNGHVPWLRKFIEHGNGIAIVRAYTSSKWWHDWASQAETIVFPKGKTKFIKPDGSIGKAPSQGIAILGMGQKANLALAKCNLGMFIVTQPYL